MQKLELANQGELAPKRFHIAGYAREDWAYLQIDLPKTGVPSNQYDLQKDTITIIGFARELVIYTNNAMAIIINISWNKSEGIFQHASSKC